MRQAVAGAGRHGYLQWLSVYHARRAAMRAILVHPPAFEHHVAILARILDIFVQSASNRSRQRPVGSVVQIDDMARHREEQVAQFQFFPVSLVFAEKLMLALFEQQQRLQHVVEVGHGDRGIRGIRGIGHDTTPKISLRRGGFILPIGRFIGQSCYFRRLYWPINVPDGQDKSAPTIMFVTMTNESWSHAILSTLETGHAQAARAFRQDSDPTLTILLLNAHPAY